MPGRNWVARSCSYFTGQIANSELTSHDYGQPVATLRASQRLAIRNTYLLKLALHCSGQPVQGTVLCALLLLLLLLLPSLCGCGTMPSVHVCQEIVCVQSSQLSSGSRRAAPHHSAVRQRIEVKDLTGQVRWYVYASWAGKRAEP